MISQTDKASRIFWEAVVSAVPPERNIVKYVSDKLLPYCLENKMIVFFSWSACSLCKDLSDESVGQARIILRFGLLTSLLFIFPGANRDKEYVFRNNCLYVTFSLYTFEPVIRCWQSHFSRSRAAQRHDSPSSATTENSRSYSLLMPMSGRTSLTKWPRRSIGWCERSMPRRPT